MDLTYRIDSQRAGLDPLVLGELCDKVEEQRRLGGLNSCQIAVAREGCLGLFATLGDASAGSHYAVYSVSKPLLASAIWLLMSSHGLDIRQCVGQTVPELRAAAIGEVTIEQLLTHTSGFPGGVLGPPQWYSREQRLAVMADWQLEWEPGSRCQYHPTSSYWVLAELAESITGMDYRDLIEQRISGPLGVSGFRLGVPFAEQRDINQVRPVGEPADGKEQEAFFGSSGVPPENAEHGMLLLMNDPDVRALGVPGGGGIANAAEVALFYQALLHNPRGIWDRAVLEDATRVIRADHPDPFSGLPANRSLGLIVQGDDGLGARRGMGATETSPRCFGHHGAGGQVAWADPASGVSFCFLTDSLDANAVRVARRGPLLSDLAAVAARHLL